MREELKNEELEGVSGGRYFINNKDILYFESMPNDAFQLVGVGARYQAQAIMDGLASQYNDAPSYDNACLNALREAGLL